MDDDDFQFVGVPRPLRGYVYALGCLTMQWNHLELELKEFAVDLLGFEDWLSHSIMRQFGDVALLELINDMVAESKNAALIAYVAHTMNFYDRCRQNRNLIIHSRYLPVGPSYKSGKLVSPADRNRRQPKQTPAELGDIQRITLDCMSCSTMLHEARQAVDGFRDGQRPDFQMRDVIFPLPELLASRPQNPPKPKSPPRSSRA